MARYQKSRAVLAASLVLALTVAMAGCQSSTQGSSTPSSNTGSVSTAPVTINMVIDNQKGSDDTAKTWKYQTVKDMEQKLNINLVLKSETPDQDKLLFASGDLPDIVYVNKPFMKQLIEGNEIMPLDDLVSQYAPDIKAQTDKINYAKKFLSDGTGKLYGITCFAGSDGNGMYPQIGYFTRWDYYTAMGYPAVSSPDDILNVVAQMVKDHPTTADGKKVYGFGVFTDWGMWPFTAFPNPGAAGLTGASSDVNVRQDGTYEIPYTDINGPIWSDLRIYNKAYQMGIFDKDSLTQKSDEYANKCNNGQYAVICASWWMTTFNQNQLKSDPNSTVGYEMLPYDGMNVYANNNQPIGSTDWQFVIGAKSQHPDVAMKFLNYLNSYDGIRQLMSGTEGTTIEDVNGKPEIKADILKQVASGDPNAPTFWNNANLMGFTQTTINPKDGQPLNLFVSDYAFTTQDTPLDKAYSSHFGADYPYGVLKNMIKDGKAQDNSFINYTVTSAEQPATDEISRIDTNLQDIIFKAASNAILAKDDAAFTAVFNKCVSDMQKAGLDKAVSFWENNYNTAKTAVDSMGQ